MKKDDSDQIHERVEEIYRGESRRIFATLIRKLGDFDLAEEALHDAFRAALEQWSRDGMPTNPRAWLVSVGRFKAIDRIRSRARLDPLDEASMPGPAAVEDEVAGKNESVDDDLLRLIFTCCHPALSPDAQVALTLREVCGLTTEAIAHAFLVPLPTLAQRIVRAKTKIREAHIPYQVPGPSELPDRLEAVLRVLYLVFNEGYDASSGDKLIRPDLSEEAIRLGRQLVLLMPEPEVLGLLALMLLHESRRAARTTTVRRPDLVGRPGPLALARRTHRRRAGPGGSGTRFAPDRGLYPAGCDCSKTCRSCDLHRDGLDEDRRLLRPAAAGGTLTRCRPEPRSGGGHAGWTGGGS